ncbi:MAG: metallophosphoesterase family protein [Hylemonella sp.]|uniref:metallophosphoesterase family protein n=1 Tax=Hylemonella sp. TaxID=2066020 RepID=UPI0022C10211|nr:metallophosphoesterase family protein [Hylemonella sp.]MCZ8253235.1 metallophosphoesterase family protein [Hylemonella sp.]
MRLALMSDLHANLHALQACLAHAREQQATHYAFLGDLVGYGADPGAVVDLVMGLAEEGALVLKGNHDEMAAHPPGSGGQQTLGETTARWTHEQLDAGQRAYLDSLPMTHQLDRALLVHATVDEPELWRYVYDAEAAGQSLDAASALEQVRYVFGGHVHRQTLYYRAADGQLVPFNPTPGVPIPVSARRHWLATIGSVGQPRDGSPKAMYTLFDGEQSELTFHRVAYDHHAAADAIRRAGLPDFFADRLEIGR